MPITIFVGGALPVFCEPLITSIGHNWYPAVNQLTIMSIHGHPIPLFVAFAYLFYFSPAIVYLIRKIDEGMTVREYWTIVISSAIFIVIYEYVGLSLGVWLYYGDAPLTVAGLPLWWIPANLMVFLPAALIIQAARPYLTGARVLLVVPFMAVQVLMFHGMISLPTYSVLNMDAGDGVKLLGMLITISLGLIACFVCAPIATRNATIPSSVLGSSRITPPPVGMSTAGDV